MKIQVFYNSASSLQTSYYLYQLIDIIAKEATTFSKQHSLRFNS